MRLPGKSVRPTNKQGGLFAGEIGEFPHLALNAKQLGPANGFIDDGEGIPLANWCGYESSRLSSDPGM
jgi:hypothetical protein